MKQEDLIEAIQAAGKLYKKKHKKEMEIFDLEYDDDGHMRIEACSKVKYTDGYFGSSKEGKKPAETILVKFHCPEGVIEDRSVEFEDEDDV